MGNNPFMKYIFSVAGAILGGLIGYLYRPSTFLVGQLPFMHVITRGKTLKGFDQMLVPVAEESFNYLLAGVIIGAILGYLVKTVVSTKK